MLNYLEPPRLREYVALDLETTGLDSTRHRIIEIGAVKFRGDEVVGIFAEYVNPYVPIPPFIQRLTGIKQADVDSASPFAALAGRLEEFIGGLPVVGHNIAFDVGFLRENGLSMNNPSYDTWDLAVTLLPTAPEYSLSLLAKGLGIIHPEPHRALEDAQITRLVFLALLKRAEALDPFVADGIRAVAQRSRWGLQDLLGEDPLTRGAIFGVPVDLKAVGSRLVKPTPLERPEKEQTLDPGLAEEMTSAQGLLSQAFPGFELRPQQARMMDAVARLFNDGGHLLVEGGTGVGKSVAYLLPAILYAVRNGARVVVSTNTINLQEQLLHKDIPSLAAALEQGGQIPKDRLRAVSLKGRANYLCVRRLVNLYGGDNLTVDEARLVSKCLVWLKDTTTGDRAEMNLVGRDSRTWARTSASDKGHCPGLRLGVCFLRAARERAETAHVIVVNHALLLSDVARGGGLIPDYDHLIIDEAHHLEEEATRQLGFVVSQGWMEEQLDALNGALTEARVAMATSDFTAPQGERTRELLAGVEQAGPGARESWGRMWRIAEEFLWTHRRESDQRVQLSVNRGTRAQPGWSDLEIGWENWDVSMGELIRRLEALARYLESLELGDGDRWGTVLSNFAIWLDEAPEARDRLKTIVNGDFQDERIDWISQEPDATLVFHSVPLDVGPILKAELFDQKHAVALSSATLTTQGTFNFIRHRLGLEGAQELRVGSPFDYKASTLLAIAEDMPPPGAPGHRAALERAIALVAEVSGGHTMALFTSHAALRAARQTLVDRLEGGGNRITVLAQGVDGPPHRLLKRFTEDPKAVLLGTSSFWEGVDLPTGVLKSLILTRLPFNVPTDPIFSARSQLYDNAFKEYAVPQAALRFRQGFGRLIRNAQDRGAVVILDKRVLSRSYGRDFLDSLPRCTVKVGPMAAISEAVRRW